jgi:O-antigen ligase
VGGAPPPAARRAADALLGFTAASIPLSTTGMELGVGGLAALSVVAAVKRWGVVRRTPLDGALACFYGGLALSTLASGHPLQATGWLRLWNVLTFFVVFWWLRDGAHATRVARLIVVAGAVAGAYGILQHFTGADWYRALLGRRTYVRPREIGTPGYAVVGFFRNYLTFAHTMLFPFSWAAALALAGDALGLLAAPIIVVALVLSTARGAWLASLAASVALALLTRTRRAVVTLGALAAAAAVVFALAPALRAEAAQMFSARGENAGRVAIYRANLDIVHARPVLGLGFGLYERAAPPYYAAHPEADRRSHAHNNFLQIAAEAGLAGLAGFCLLYASALRRGLEAFVRSPERTATAGAIAGVIAFLVGGLTQYTFGDAEVAIAMWLALAVLARCREEAGD